MPETVKFGTGRESDTPPIPGFLSSENLFGVCRNVRVIDAKQSIATCKLFGDYRKRETRLSYTSWLGELRVGDTVPISRAVYRLESMKDPGLKVANPHAALVPP